MNTKLSNKITLDSTNLIISVISNGFGPARRKKRRRDEISSVYPDGVVVRNAVLNNVILTFLNSHIFISGVPATPAG